MFQIPCSILSEKIHLTTRSGEFTYYTSEKLPYTPGEILLQKISRKSNSLLKEQQFCLPRSLGLFIYCHVNPTSLFSPRAVLDEEKVRRATKNVPGATRRLPARNCVFPTYISVLNQLKNLALKFAKSSRRGSVTARISVIRDAESRAVFSFPVHPRQDGAARRINTNIHEARYYATTVTAAHYDESELRVALS